MLARHTSVLAAIEFDVCLKEWLPYLLDGSFERNVQTLDQYLKAVLYAIGLASIGNCIGSNAGDCGT